MPMDEGVNWEGKAGTEAGANIEVTATSSPEKTGVIRLEFKANAEPPLLAKETAKEWNARSPLDDVIAIASANSGLVRFLHREPTGEIVGIAVTFDDETRKELAPGDHATAHDGSVLLRRVNVSFSAPAPSN